MNRKLMTILAAAGLMGSTVSAHHSFSAEFDAKKVVKLDGRVVKMDWVNPHAWLYMDVPTADGKTERWAVEFGSPNVLFRGGWKKDTVKAGDKISVRCHVAKDGSDNCLLGFLTTEGGVPKEFD